MTSITDSRLQTPASHHRLYNMLVFIPSYQSRHRQNLITNLSSSHERLARIVKCD
jgi:hypothetical protein